MRLIPVVFVSTNRSCLRRRRTGYRPASHFEAFLTLNRFVKVLKAIVACLPELLGLSILACEFAKTRRRKASARARRRSSMGSRISFFGESRFFAV